MIISSIGVLMVLLSLSSVLIANPGSEFSEAEKSLISDSSNGPVMKVFLTDIPEEEAFLRLNAIGIDSTLYKHILFRTLCDRMIATAEDPENDGVGIAAPQVGISRRVIAVQRFDKEGQPYGIYINPQITGSSEETTIGTEGCLSVPDSYKSIERARTVTVTYNDPEDFSEKEETIEGLTAVIFQHEIDHLNGILFTDRFDPSLETELEAGPDNTDH